MAVPLGPPFEGERKSGFQGPHTWPPTLWRESAYLWLLFSSYRSNILPMYLHIRTYCNQLGSGMHRVIGCHCKFVAWVPAGFLFWSFDLSLGVTLFVGLS